MLFVVKKYRITVGSLFFMLGLTGWCVGIVMIKKKKVDGMNMSIMLANEEKILLDDVNQHPEMYKTHHWTEHNSLCKKHHRCVLCLSGSRIVFV